jgi:hypothetical protein
MTEFIKLGGVGVLGYISPIDTEDTYPVIDPLYGIDGIRNVANINEMIEIPIERRRGGMIVGVQDENKYYKLKNIDWVGDISDWSELYLVSIDEKQSEYNFSDREIPEGSVNNINHIFTLTNIPIIGSEHVYVNGLLQESNYDYVINDNEITFFEPPISGMRIRCSYRY